MKKWVGTSSTRVFIVTNIIVNYHDYHQHDIMSIIVIIIIISYEHFCKEEYCGEDPTEEIESKASGFQGGANAREDHHHHHHHDQ